MCWYSHVTQRHLLCLLHSGAMRHTHRVSMHSDSIRISLEMLEGKTFNRSYRTLSRRWTNLGDVPLQRAAPSAFAPCPCLKHRHKMSHCSQCDQRVYVVCARPFRPTFRICACEPLKMQMSSAVFSLAEPWIYVEGTSFPSHKCSIRCILMEYFDKPEKLTPQIPIRRTTICYSIIIKGQVGYHKQI